jgi:alpha-1,2-mannosyltransferase
VVTLTPSPSSKQGSIKARLTTVKLSVAALLLLLSVFHFVHAAHNSRAFGFVDFPIFLAQAELYLITGELYVDASDPESYGPAAAVYKFPPLFAMLLLPFVRGGVSDSVYLGHWVLQILLYAAAVGLLVANLRRQGGAIFAFVGTLLALNFEPFFETLWRLQLETPILLLLVLALVAYQTGRQPWAGIAIGVGFMLKLYPAFLLLFFALRRGWKVMVGFVAAVALIVIASLIVIGPGENAAYFFKILPLLFDEAPRVSTENLSPARHFQVLFGMDGAWAKRLAQLIVVPLIALTAFAVARRGPRPGDRLAVATAFSLFIPLMLLAMPNSWVNYQLLLLLPLLVLLCHCARPGPDRVALTALLAAAYLPLLFYWPCEAASVPWPCAQTPYFLGLVRLPRGFHDLMVDARALSPLLVWTGLFSVLFYGRGTDSTPGHGGEAESADRLR